MKTTAEIEVMKGYEEEKKYRPYKNTNEMIDDFCKRSGAKRSVMGEPFIWVKEDDCKMFIIKIDDFFCDVAGVIWDMQELFERFTYLDGSPCGMLE